MKPYQKNRSRAYFRHHRRRVIRRKSQIAKHTGWHSRFSGYFAKGKVHCSCGLCAVKTKNDGYPHSQIKQLERMNNQLHNYLLDLDR